MEDIMALDCMPGSTYTPDACERETERTYNATRMQCACGGRLIYRHAIGGRKCSHCGALHRVNGKRI